MKTGLFGAADGLRFYHEVLAQSNAIIVIHNSPFDLGVAVAADERLIVPVFDAYDAGRICNTITLQKLIDVALGMRKFRRFNGKTTKTTYTLADLIDLYYGETVEKLDTWRKSYAFLKDISVDQWPKSARQYAIDDSVYHLRLWEAQQRLIAETFNGHLPNQIEQQRAAWVLHLMSMWGIRAEASRVEYFIAHCTEEVRKMKETLKDTAIFKKDGSRTMVEIRRRVVEACGRMQMSVPMTDPSTRFPHGQVQTDKETLEETDDPMLHVLAKSMTFAKHLGQWGPVLRAAVLRPVCCRYDELVETGRTSSSGSEGQEGTNIQNPPREGDVRPCIVPRRGFVFCSTDADTIELRAHAQNCLDLIDWSRMAEHLLDQARSGGPDLHEVLGAGIAGVDPRILQAARKAGDKEMNAVRQFAKVPNYGYPGGLGAPTMVSFAAGQLSREAFEKWFTLDREEAVRRSMHLREVWFETFPENREYFKIVGQMIDRQKGYGTIQQLMSKRIRGEVRFTAAANGFFQGRVAEAMKEVLWRLAMECYTGRETDKENRLNGKRSVLLGSRPVMFLHDEPIAEHPEDGSESDRAERQRVIMVECLSRWMPAIPCTSSAVLIRRWEKGAEPIFVGGKLVPVKSVKTEVDGKKKVTWVQDFGDT
jgi:hypothetical protein